MRKAALPAFAVCQSSIRLDATFRRYASRRKIGCPFPVRYSRPISAGILRSVFRTAGCGTIACSFFPHAARHPAVAIRSRRNLQPAVMRFRRSNAHAPAGRAAAIRGNGSIVGSPRPTASWRCASQNPADWHPCAAASLSPRTAGRRDVFSCRWYPVQDGCRRSGAGVSHTRRRTDCRSCLPVARPCIPRRGRYACGTSRVTSCGVPVLAGCKVRMRFDLITDPYRRTGMARRMYPAAPPQHGRVLDGTIHLGPNVFGAAHGIRSDASLVPVYHLLSRRAGIPGRRCTGKAGALVHRHPSRHKNQTRQYG